MNEDRRIRNSTPSLDEWGELLKEISEVARDCLHRLVETSTPPLPACYERQFMVSAHRLKRTKVKELVLGDQEEAAERIRSAILAAKESVGEARRVLERFEREAEQHFSELERHIASVGEDLGSIRTPHEKEEFLKSLLAVTSANAALLQEVNLAVAGVVKQENLLAELAKKVNEDPLTGVFNRRAWEQALEDVSAGLREKGHGGKFSIIMADIDHFKMVNDTHGHRVGDAVLKQFAMLLQDHYASCGPVYRYGGEEFSVILPGVDLDEALSLTESFRKRLNNTRFVVNRCKGSGESLRMRITASFGVATWGGSDVDSVVEAADACLYKAKELGRNRIEAIRL